MAAPEYLQTLDIDMDNISSLSRLPNKDDELSYKDLQQLFDKAGNDIKTFINETMLADIEQGIARHGQGGTNKIDGGYIITNTLPANRIVNNSLSADQIASYAIGTEQLASSSVTYDKLATDAVRTAKIKDREVTTAKIALGAITDDELADDAVTIDKLDDTSVATTVNGKVGAAVLFKFKSGTSTIFETDSTLTDYPYRASVTDADVSADDKVYVEFSATQINLGVFAPITTSYDGGFYIYCEDANHAAETVSYTILKA